MTPVPHASRVRGRINPLLAALAGAFLLTGGLTGCESQEFEQKEVLPMVEVTYDEAIRMSLEEVEGSGFVSITLHRPRSVHPEWDTVVVDEKNTSSLVRVSATSERLLSSRTLPPGETPPPERVSAARRMTVLPEKAVKKITKPEFGKVTSVRPGVAENRPVWTVVVATIQGAHRFAYDVDGVTGEVLDRRAAGPGDSALRSPARP
jgi:hypothetical protein